MDFLLGLNSMDWLKGKKWKKKLIAGNHGLFSHKNIGILSDLFQCSDQFCGWFPGYGCSISQKAKNVTDPHVFSMPSRCGSLLGITLGDDLE